MAEKAIPVKDKDLSNIAWIVANGHRLFHVCRPSRIHVTHSLKVHAVAVNSASFRRRDQQQIQVLKPVRRARKPAVARPVGLRRDADLAMNSGVVGADQEAAYNSGVSRRPWYSPPPSAGDFSIKPQIMITSDGRYLVTVVPGPWPQGNDAIVDVIDPQTFHFVTTQRTSEHGFGGDWQLDAEGGSVQVHGLTPSSTKPAGSEQWLAFWSLPGLQPLERCDYSVVFKPPNSVPVLRAEFHGPPSPACAREAQSRLTHQNEPGEFHKLSGLLGSAWGVGQWALIRHRQAMNFSTVHSLLDLSAWFVRVVQSHSNLILTSKAMFCMKIILSFPVPAYC